MSHVVTCDVEIKDLPSLAKACESLGLELVKDQKTFKWWGRHVGDYPIPEGFTKDDMGKCDHAIRVKGDSYAYEIGVVRRKQGTGYDLMFDFYGSKGKSIERVAGKKCSSLAQEYSLSLSESVMRKQGWSVQRNKLADGTVKLVCNK